VRETRDRGQKEKKAEPKSKNNSNRSAKAVKRRGSTNTAVEKRISAKKEEVSSGSTKEAVVRKASIQKENDSRAQQPRASKAKSAANSLPRGIDLGVNVKKIKDGDAPKDMDDYMERERARRRQRSKGSKTTKAVAYEVPKKKTRANAEVPTKLVSRLQIRKESELEKNTPIGGNRINKPAGSKDLASKRAAYFESLLQNQE